MQELTSVVKVYLELGVILLFLWIGFFFIKKKWGNTLFLSKGEIELPEIGKFKILKIIPFVDNSYLIFVEISLPQEKIFEIWSYTRKDGFKILLRKELKNR
jgi:hypothetical protein